MAKKMTFRSLPGNSNAVARQVCSSFECEVLTNDMCHVLKQKRFQINKMHRNYLFLIPFIYQCSYKGSFQHI